MQSTGKSTVKNTDIIHTKAIALEMQPSAKRSSQLQFKLNLTNDTWHAYDSISCAWTPRSAVGHSTSLNSLKDIHVFIFVERQNAARIEPEASSNRECDIRLSWLFAADRGRAHDASIGHTVQHSASTGISLSSASMLFPASTAMASMQNCKSRVTKSINYEGHLWNNVITADIHTVANVTCFFGVKLMCAKNSYNRQQRRFIWRPRDSRKRTS